MMFGWNSGPDDPAMACRQRDREKENKKKKGKEKKEKSTNQQQWCIKKSINIAYQQFQILTKKQYCNLLLKEKITVVGINKLHIFT